MEDRRYGGNGCRGCRNIEYGKKTAGFSVLCFSLGKEREGGGTRNYRASFFNAQLPLGSLFHFGGEESRSTGELTERNLGRHLRPTPRNFPN